MMSSYSTEYRVHVVKDITVPYRIQSRRGQRCHCTLQNTEYTWSKMSLYSTEYRVHVFNDVIVLYRIQSTRGQRCTVLFRIQSRLGQRCHCTLQNTEYAWSKMSLYSTEYRVHVVKDALYSTEYRIGLVKDVIVLYRIQSRRGQRCHCTLQNSE